MRKWIPVTLLLVMSAGLWSSRVLAQPHGPRGMGGMGGMMMGDGSRMLLPMLLRSVELTPAQKEQVQAIMATHRQAFPGLMRQLREAHESLATRLLAPGDVRAEDLTPQVQRITQLREQLVQEGLRVVLAVRQILTPEQLAKAGQIRGRMQTLQEEMRGLLPGPHDEVGTDDEEPAPQSRR